MLPHVAPVGMLSTALLLATSLSSAAAQVNRCSQSTPSTAELFNVEFFANYKIINSTQCNERYVLYPRGGSAPDLGTGFTYFAVPLTRVALTTTVPVAFLEAVRARNTIKVVSPYTTSPCVANLASTGAASSLMASWSNATAHALLVGHGMDSSIDAVVSDPFGTPSWPYPETRHKVICAASTYEPNPLGGAEWVKFWGHFFDEMTLANNAFCATHSRYSCNSMAASNIAGAAIQVGSQTHTARVPTVLFAQYSSWYSNYQIAMTPYKNRIVHDAGATYPDMTPFSAFQVQHATAGYTSGFTFPSANRSQFLAALSLADIIIDETYPNGQTLITLTTQYGLENTAPASMPRAFRNSNVYTLDGTMSANNQGTDYYESRVAEPDGLLADIIEVAHPNRPSNLPPRTMAYLRNAETGTQTVVSASMCTDVNAPRPVRSSTCSGLAATSGGTLSWLAGLDYVPPAPTPPPPSASPHPPPTPPPPTTDATTDAAANATLAPTSSAQTSLISNDGTPTIIGLAVAAGVLGLGLTAMVAYLLCRKTPTKSITVETVEVVESSVESKI